MAMSSISKTNSNIRKLKSAINRAIREMNKAEDAAISIIEFSADAADEACSRSVNYKRVEDAEKTLHDAMHIGNDKLVKLATAELKRIKSFMKTNSEAWGAKSHRMKVRMHTVNSTAVTVRGSILDLLIKMHETSSVIEDIVSMGKGG